MSIKNVIVFGATGLQGRPQIVEALRQGYAVRAVSRRADVFSAPEFKGVVPVQADYNDPASLDKALAGVDAALIQVPSAGNLEKTLEQCKVLGAAMKKAGVQLIVFNSSMWGPDEPCGAPIFDYVLKFEEAFRNSGVPTIVFRPTVFMQNLIEPFMKPMFVVEHVYRYCHKADLASDWICHEDLARFMVEALKHPELAGRKIGVGGPQRLTTLQVIEILSEAIGHPIQHQYITPTQLGQKVYDLTVQGQGTGGEVTGVSRDEFAAGIASFYDFVHDSPLRPFQADVKAALALLPVQLTDMRTWAKKQDWSLKSARDQI